MVKKFLKKFVKKIRQKNRQKNRQNIHQTKRTKNNKVTQKLKNPKEPWLQNISVNKYHLVVTNLGS